MVSDSQPNYLPIYLGVIGKPISQSLSPIIHQTALQEVGLTGAYIRLAVDSVNEALSCAKEMGLKGLNVTSPFKVEVLESIKDLDQDVRQVEAANTIVFGESVSAYNTDLYGIAESFGLNSKRSEGKTALIIGAGGAAKGAAYALKQNGCKVFICNRTMEKADGAAAKLGVESISFEMAAQLLESTDYLINTVFAAEELLDLTDLQSHTLILDAIYAKQTSFSESCSKNPNYIDGKTWLLHQGVRAFEIFTGVKISESQLLTIKNKLFSEAYSRPQTISLIGMMGSGKTGVGNVLGSYRDSIDLDEQVEKKAGSTIAKLVTEKGEARFREIENECLAEALERKPQILSCGAGIIGNSVNRQLLKEQTTPVWLWASSAELTKRLEKVSNRPLLFGHDLPTRVCELLGQRFSYYAELSELVIPTAGKTTEEIAKRIAFEFFNDN